MGMYDTRHKEGREIETILYDVCNDYTLEPCIQAINLIGEYKAIEGALGVSYFHIRYNELHYFRGPAGLTGLSWYDVH